MNSTAPADPDTDSPPDAMPGGGHGRFPRLRRLRPDLAVCLAFLLLGAYLTHGLWPAPGERVLALNPPDQVLYEWFLAVDSRALLGELGLGTDRLNAPDGVNLLANTSVIALGLLFAPVTLAFGAPVSFALLVAAGLAGTAIAWYLLFTRTLGARRFPAVVGAALCGFGPGMVSQSNSHLHMTVQWLVPVIVWLVVRLLRAAAPGITTTGTGAPETTATSSGAPKSTAPGPAPDWRRLLTSAAGLAVAVTVQIFIGEEVLFLTAVTLLVLTICYALRERRYARRAFGPFAAGLTAAAGLALMVLAYPLWYQFAGPLGVADGMFSPHYFSADLASWALRSPLTVAADPDNARLTTGPAEYNTYLGLPLLLAGLGCAIWLRRNALALACAITALVMAALSLGPEIVLGGNRTGIPGPYALLAGVPVVDGALPMRFALPVLPLLATIFVLALDRARDARRPYRIGVPVAAVAVLLTVFPTPLPTEQRPALPEFISAGHWRDCAGEDGVLVPVPSATPRDPWPMRWATAAHAGFAIPEGFFIGSYGADGSAAMGTYRRPTSALLAEVARTGQVPAIGERERNQARADLAFWGSSCVVLATDADQAEPLRRSLEQLYGPATPVADVWTWRLG